MSKLTWVISESVLGEKAKKIESVALSLGHSTFRFNLDEDDIRQMLFRANIKVGQSGTNNVVFLGSVSEMTIVQRHLDWFPDYCDFENFKCSSYYPHYYNGLLNSNHVLCPYGLLTYTKFVERAVKSLGSPKEVFIRPNSGKKIFDGRLVLADDLLNKKDFLYENIDKSELVLLAARREILSEWRVIIVEGKVVDLCMYECVGDRKDSHLFPDWMKSHIINFAERVAKAYSPHTAFVLDVAECADCIDSGEDLEIIEINSINCADWYSCSVEKVVKALSEVSIRIYNTFS